ncbi:unnamed protein product, partial [Amoebophrya sp. A25]
VTGGAPLALLDFNTKKLLKDIQHAKNLRNPFHPIEHLERAEKCALDLHWRQHLFLYGPNLSIYLRLRYLYWSLA